MGRATDAANRECPAHQWRIEHQSPPPILGSYRINASGSRDFVAHGAQAFRSEKVGGGRAKHVNSASVRLLNLNFARLEFGTVLFKNLCASASFEETGPKPDHDGSHQNGTSIPSIIRTAATPKTMLDFGDEEYLQVICVESGNVASNRSTLLPGSTLRLKVELSSAALS